MTGRAGAAALLVACSVACSPSGLAADRRSDGPPVFTNRNTRDFLDAEVSGMVGVEAGCFVLDGQPVVWPIGTIADGSGVRLRDGTTIAPGDAVTGGGGYHPADGFTRLDTERHVLEDLLACASAGGEIVVLNGGGQVQVTTGG